MNKLGEYIKNIRDKRGLSLRDFSKLVGLSHNYIGILEKGIDPKSNKPVIPTIETLIKLSSAIGISLVDLLIISGYIDDTNDINKDYSEETLKEFYLLAKDFDFKQLLAAKAMLDRGISLIEINKALKENPKKTD